MELKIEHTNVFRRNYEALLDNNIRFVINQGGTRSSKTYSLCQLFIVYLLQNPNKTVSIVRKSFPSLRATVMRDFFEIMRGYNLYEEKHHNKTENIYQFPNGSQIEFFSLDDEQKIRGRKRDVLFANEANELSFDEYSQLNFRTTEKLFFDFNPSNTHHWLYKLIEKDDAIKIHSTYKDNSFLSKSLVKEIEDLIEVDEDYYNIYALGLPSKSKDVVYSHHKFHNHKPISKKTILGIDFGYIDQTALVRVDIIDDQFYIKELLFESYLTSTDILDRLRRIYKDEELSLNTDLICDYARPEIMQELSRGGFNPINAIKDIKAGIDSVKTSKISIDENSTNLIEELSNYKWKKNRAGELLDEPLDKFNHLMDAMRYAIHWYKVDSEKGGDVDFITFQF